MVLAAPSLSINASSQIGASESGLSAPPHAHVRWANDRFIAGASLTVPFGSSVAWPVGWRGRFELLEAKVQVLRASAFAGARFYGVSVAAGAFVDSARLGFKRAVDFIDAEGTTEIDTRATGAGAQVAAFFAPTDDLRVGLSYQSRSKLSFSGFADFDVPAEFQRRASDQAVRTSVLLPDRFRLGAMYQLTSDLRLMVDLELVVWSTVDRLVIDFEREEMSDLEQPRGWNTTLTPRFGALWDALSFLEARAGFFVDPSPVPAETVGPSSPDSTRLGITAGVGLRPIDALSIDLGYQWLIFTGQEGEMASIGRVRYEGTAHLAGISVAASL